MEIGYIGSVGRHLRIQRNINQFIYPGGKSSSSLPNAIDCKRIHTGRLSGNIAYVDSDSYSDYNALWFTMRKALSHGIQVNSTYTWSKSMDVNSLGSQGGYNLQNNFDPHGNYGLSDFDARNHFVFSGTWELPFRGNRLKEGWLLANITQLQSGNPLNVTTTSTYNGVTARFVPQCIPGPNSQPEEVQFWPLVTLRSSTARRAPPSLPDAPSTRNLPDSETSPAMRLTGPGFADTDLSLQKTTRHPPSPFLWCCASIPSIFSTM